MRCRQNQGDTGNMVSITVEPSPSVINGLCTQPVAIYGSIGGTAFENVMF
jgi:hypothetical protein